MKNINFPAYYSKKESKIFYNLPTSCIKTFQKAVGCAGKALQRNLLTFYYCVSKHIAEVTLGDIACYP